MPESAPDLTFAIISSAPAASALLETVCTELEKRTQLSIKPRVVRSYEKLLEAICDGQVQVAWAPPLVAIDLEHEKAAKIRLCSRRAGKRDYMSAIFVKADSDIRTINDLRGKRLAWVAKESSAGYVVPRLQLIGHGLDPDKDLGEQSFRRTHEAVARAVLAGDADAGATYASFTQEVAEPVSAGWVEAGIKHDEVRILDTAGPIPTDVIAFSTKLTDERATLVAAAMQQLGSPIRQLLNADAFDEPEQTHFDSLRLLVSKGRKKPG